MPAVEVIAVGTELLLGQLTDTNSRTIAQALAGAGIDVFATHTVGDNRARIATAVRGALERAGGVITTGGLGPTVDDLTKEAIADVLGVELELHAPSLAWIQAAFARLGREMRDNNRKQAMLPRGAVVLPNLHGTAPGFAVVRADGKFVAALPGPPREMRPMLEERLIPWLRERYDVRAAIFTRVLHTVGIAESEIDHRIDDLFRAGENPKIAVLAHDYRCDVKVMAKAESVERGQALIAPVEAELRRRLEGHVFGTDEQTLPGAIHQALQQAASTLAVAESCTGGALGAALASTPGASKAFLGGIIAYDNAVKHNLLGVRMQTLERYGAVSEEAAREMAAGARERLGASIGLAVTGIAGPDGGTPEKPVGTVWLGYADDQDGHTARLTLHGDRAAIQARAVTAALALLWRRVAQTEPKRG